MINIQELISKMRTFNQHYYNLLEELGKLYELTAQKEVIEEMIDELLILYLDGMSSEIRSFVKDKIK